MDVSPSGGIVEVDRTAPTSYPDSSSFADGASVELRALPTPGYRFDGWSGDISGTTNPVTITIDCNKRVIANFSRTMHTLKVQVNGSGSTIPTTGNHNYEGGTTVDISATADSGWQFEGWTGDVADPASTSTILIMDSDKTVVANFAPVKHGWWLAGGIIAGVLVIGVIIWLALRTRNA